MKTHPRMLEWSCALVLCALGASTLACAFPTVPGRYGPSPDPPSGDELEDPPPPPGAERERIDEPDAPEEEPGEASPPEADQGAAVAEAPPPEPEEPALPPAPSDGDRITPVLERCQEGQAEACRRYALGALAVSTEPAVQSRAAMAMYRACEMGLGAACYEYALMVWMRAGANYDAAEIAYGFERARELDESRAGTGYGELIRPPEPGAPLREETLRHHEHACAMSLRQACDALAAAAEGPTAPEIVYEEIDLSASRGLTKEQARATLTEARPKLNACYRGARARPGGRRHPRVHAADLPDRASPDGAHGRLHALGQGGRGVRRRDAARAEIRPAFE